MIALQARKLANYIEKLEDFSAVAFYQSWDHDHIGALFTEVVLQAGLNYKSVVKPRVDSLLSSFPEAKTRIQFEKLINQIGLDKLISWKHPEKLRRMHDLVNFARQNRINSCSDLRNFLTYQDHRNQFQAIKGFGPKTVDYTLKLLNFDTVAVDRHIYSFVSMADISVKNYQVIKQVVEYAADFLEISRSAMDHSIWLYMSQKGSNELLSNKQLSMTL